MVTKRKNDKPAVLVVDDDPKIRRLVATYLGRDGYEVFLAATGEEAMAMLERPEEPINAVVMDVLDVLTTVFFGHLAMRGAWPAAIAAAPLATLLYFGWESSRPFFAVQIVSLALIAVATEAGIAAGEAEDRVPVERQLAVHLHHGGARDGVQADRPERDVAHRSHGAAPGALRRSGGGHEERQDRSRKQQRGRPRTGGPPFGSSQYHRRPGFSGRPAA